MSNQGTEELARLKTERLDLLQRLKQNEIDIASFAPVNTVPDHVLMLIFEEAYRHRYSDHSSPALCKMPNPTVVGQVSRRWRRVAIALPSLWTCIHAEYPDYINALFFVRSQGLPLQFVSQSTTRDLDELIRILQRDAPRWKHVQFGGKDRQAGTMFMQAMRIAEVPNLESVTLYHPDHLVDYHQREWSIDVVPNGHFWGRLKHLMMHGVRLDERLPQLPSLETLHIGLPYINGDQLKNLSLAFPNLLEVTFHALSLSRGVGVRPPLVSFRSLRTIKFDITPWEDLTSFIDAPQLRSLVCKEGPIYIGPIDTSIYSPRVYPSLTHIRLNRCIMEGASPSIGHILQNNEIDSTFQLFRQSPNLKSLELLDCMSNNMHQFFIWLRDTTNDEERVILPVLESVAIENLHVHELGIVEEFCRRRSRHQPPLKELKLGKTTVEALGPELLYGISQLVHITTLPDF